MPHVKFPRCMCSVLSNSTNRNKNIELSDGYLGIIRASMGEYVVDTGINGQLPLCEMFYEPIIFGPILQMFGFDENNCPPKPGVYGSENYTFPTSMFPDDFPPNKYKVAFEIINESKQLLVIHVYADVQ
ncbi:hypothetical protein KQX54_016291 [Cotesia glomerata]|uniref:Uncharacterized protein n=1 Tax=Cotesia glomerata TaxID=32391 RepID=A0AAV7I9P8_COTGL|nr:hypothetical protein KQX54_016291 [Cotesia glomerata]